MSTNSSFYTSFPAAAALGRARSYGPEVVIACGLLVVAIGTTGMLRGVEPFASWYYFFAWYGTLLATDGTLALLGGPRDAEGMSGGRDRFLLIGRPAHALTLLGWSAVVWLFYELLNFRLQNWYYVFLPDALALRWAGTLLAFATVLPAVFLSEALLDRLGVARATRWPAFRVSDGLLVGLRAAGAAMMLLVLVWPRYFFPLVWGATTLLVEPSVYRHAPARSLLGDLSRGEPGRILRLLLGGAAIGLLWEVFNVSARTKWIYTVPGLEEFKLFEMPVLGFLGFPPFALECFVLWQALVVGGLAVPRYGAAVRTPRHRRIGAALAAVAFSVGVLTGMDARTVSSLRPQLDELPGVPGPLLARAGLGPFSLAGADADWLAERLDVGVAEAHRWIETARLTTLRGIGASHATVLRQLGIESIEALARADAAELARRIEAHTGAGVVEARIRVWVRAARHALHVDRWPRSP